jgi:exosortase
MTVGAALRSPWTSLAAGNVAIVTLFAPIFPSMVHEWATFSSLSHGFVVPFVSTYLVWVRRADLRRQVPTPASAGLPVLLGGVLMYVAGTLAHESFLARIAFLVALSGGILYLGGYAVMRTVAPGVAYLTLMIPLPYVAVKELTDELRVVEATVSAWILPLIGVPVMQEGVLLHLANATLEVAEACSSIPAMLSLLALGAALAYVTRRPPLVHLVLVAAAVPLGFASNIARIAMTAAGVYYIGPVALAGVLHTWHGTVVFVMTFAALSLVNLGLMRLRPSVP